MSWGCVDTCCLEQHRARSPEGSLKYANAPNSSDTSDSVLVGKEWCRHTAWRKKTLAKFGGGSSVMAVGLWDEGGKFKHG